MSVGPPVLWLSTNAVQLTLPLGDDRQLMSSGSGASSGPPVLWLSTHAVQSEMSVLPAVFPSEISVRRVIFSADMSVLQLSEIPLFRSPNFSAPLSFLFAALQTFPFRFVSFSALLSACHSLDGWVFRGKGNHMFVHHYYSSIYICTYMHIYAHICAYMHIYDPYGHIWTYMWPYMDICIAI